MRSKLLGTVSATAIVIGAYAAQDAKADDGFAWPSGEDWYVSVFGGAAFNEQAHALYNGDINDIDVKDGFTIGGAIGTHIAAGLRAEAEVSYLRHANRRTRDRANTDYDSVSDHMESVFFLGNLWKDIDVRLASLYLGGGLGVALLSNDGNFSVFANQANGWEDTEVALAAQLGGGLRFALTNQLALDAGYRFKMAVDANFNSLFTNRFFGGTPRNTDHSAMSLYDHIVQVGLTYSFDKDGQILPAAAGDPDAADWYVSIFGAPVFGEDMPLSDGSTYALNNKTGFTLGAAAGTNLAPGLRGELEFSYLRQEADSINDANTVSPADGHINQLFFLGNLWKDFHLGPVAPYVGLGVGVGIVDFDDYDPPGNVIDRKAIGLAAQIGAGVRYALTDNLVFDAGYRFKSIVGAFVEGRNQAGFQSNHFRSATFNHTVQLGLTYGFNGTSILPAAAEGEPEPDWYATLFGGAAHTIDTTLSYDGSTLSLDLEPGFTIGAAVGTEVLPGLRGEVEVSYVETDPDDETDGTSVTESPGDIDFTYVLVNLWKDFNLGGGFFPYAGAGLGFVVADVDAFIDSSFDDTSVGLGAQVGAGVKYYVTDGVFLDAGYRLKGALAVLSKNAADEKHIHGSYFTHIFQGGVGMDF